MVKAFSPTANSAVEFLIVKGAKKSDRFFKNALALFLLFFLLIF